MSKSDKLSELEHRIAELEQQRSPGERIKAACTRREFVYGGIVGAAGMAAMTGTAAAQTFPEDFHGMALLIGDDADKPDPSGSFFDNKSEYHYVYFATDTGKIYTLETEDSSWQLFGSGAVGGGGGGDIEYQEDGSSLTTAVGVINAATGITATEPTADEIDIDLDESVLKDGGAKELDVADLAGGLGTSGQIPETDGAAVSWVDKVLSDSGSDTGDGGDIYQLPQTQDAIDFQSGGELQNVESIDAGELDITSGVHELIHSGGIEQYPADLSSLRQMITDAQAGDWLLVAPGTYDLGTTTLGPLPNQVGFGSFGGKRSVQFTASDGIGAAIQPGAENYLANFHVDGDANGTADDIGIEPPTGAGFTTAYNIEIDRFWKNLYLDNHFNSRWYACNFGTSRTGQTQGASVHVDVASGSNNDTRFVIPYFGSNNTRMAWIEANNVTFVGPHGESNSGTELYHHDFGGQLNISQCSHHGEEVDTGYNGAGGSEVYMTGSLQRLTSLATSGTAIDGSQVTDGKWDVQVSGSWATEYANIAADTRVVHGIEGASSDPGLTFGTWRTPNTAHPVIVQTGAVVQTDGSSPGHVEVEVDESGGTTADYKYVAYADKEAGSGYQSDNYVTLFIPPGGAYRLVNVSDPNSGNGIRDTREFVVG